MPANDLEKRFQSSGLNLFAVLDSREFADFAAFEGYRSLLLIGNSGPAMWRLMPAHYQARENPVDDYARDAVSSVLADVDTIGAWKVLFPAPDSHSRCPPLQQLGAAAGWHHASPLGIGINADSGLWFAYRAVIAVTHELQATKRLSGESPCLTCRNRECVVNCPAEAVSIGNLPDMKSCARHRVKLGSSCGDSCQSRLSCPVAPQLIYGREQIRHHYMSSLPTLRQWVAALPADPE